MHEYSTQEAHMCFVLSANHNLLDHDKELKFTFMPTLRLCLLRNAEAIFRSSSRWNQAG